LELPVNVFFGFLDKNSAEELLSKDLKSPARIKYSLEIYKK
jgi:hypothetical protein